MSGTPGQANESADDALRQVLEAGGTVEFLDDHTFLIGNEREAMVCRAKGGGLIECFPPVQTARLLDGVVTLQEYGV